MDRNLQTGPSTCALFFCLHSWSRPEPSPKGLSRPSLPTLWSSNRFAFSDQVARGFKDTGGPDLRRFHHPVDVHHLWATGRFDDIRVETTREDEGTGVVFHVVEMPQLRLRQLHVEAFHLWTADELPEGTP